MKEKNRRKFLKELGVSVASASLYLNSSPVAFAGLQPLLNTSFQDDFKTTTDRVWIGEKYWSIPLEDWRVANGRVECIGNVPNSRINLLTTILAERKGDFTVTADLGTVEEKLKDNPSGSAGFSIGIKDEIDQDVKAACYYGKGLLAGISLKGTLFIGNQTKPLPKNFNFTKVSVSVKGENSGNSTLLRISCKDKNGKTAELAYETTENITGLVALVNNFEERGGANFWYQNFSVSGSKTAEKPGNSFGPILWAMHTLSKGNLNLMAQMPPLGVKDSQTLELQVKKGKTWQRIATQKIEQPSYTVNFNLNNWDTLQDIPYLLVYNNNGQRFTYEGTIRKEPVNRPLRFGGLTCQEWGGYPYSPLVKNLKKHDPDLVFFSGDQLYEGNGGYPIKRAPVGDSILSYLGKWYMFGWAFGDIMRDRPAICTPDDHDVFHGNLWGEGGKLIPVEKWEKIRDAHGGYVQSPEMVNVVAQTQCGNLPAPYQAQPLNSGIKTWYTDLVYGKVSFAIISDRMFKSGPEMVRAGVGRLDHLTKPVNKEELEDPNLEMLGKNQMQFLQNWVQDWEGANMKVLLSQTLFCNVGTHHGPEKMFLYGDMDSGGWPRQKRDEALRLVRKAATFHINGDQHLPFLVQYSIDNERDGGWTYCTPAISTGYIRWGQPDLMKVPFSQRPAHGLENTGLYPDGFGNRNFIYAVGNPIDNYQHKNRYLRAQNKSSGFGIITFDTTARTIKMEAYRFLADKDKPTPEDQFPGWPYTISQTDNDGRKPVAFLPNLEINKPDQVIKIIHDQSKEIIRAIRIKGSTYQPGVHAEGSYTVLIGEGNSVKELKQLKTSKKVSKKLIKVIV